MLLLRTIFIDELSCRCFPCLAAISVILERVSVLLMGSSGIFLGEHINKQTRWRAMSLVMMMNNLFRVSHDTKWDLFFIFRLKQCEWRRGIITLSFDEDFIRGCHRKKSNNNNPATFTFPSAFPAVQRESHYIHEAST